MNALLVVATPLAYLLGTFPSATLVARAAGIDIRSIGSGNPGASNVMRSLGWKKGALVFALDAVKGMVAAAIGLWIAGRAGGHVLGIAAVIGHIFPITYRLRGGKGVATAAGMMLVVHPIVGVAIAALWFAVSRLTGKAAVASLAAVTAAPIGVALRGRPAWQVAAVAAVSALLIARHASNIKRLITHTEPTLKRTN